MLNTLCLKDKSAILSAPYSLELLKFEKAKCSQNCCLVDRKCRFKDIEHIVLCHRQIVQSVNSFRIDAHRARAVFSTVLSSLWSILSEKWPEIGRVSLGVRDMDPPTWPFCWFWTILACLPRLKGAPTHFVENTWPNPFKSS